VRWWLAIALFTLNGCITRTVYVEVPVLPEPVDEHELIEAVEELIETCGYHEPGQFSTHF